MIEVTPDEHYAAARFAVLTGGRFVRTQTAGLSNHGAGELLEYVRPDGSVLARKVVACGQTLCWLRADIAAAAHAALAAEAAEHGRIKAALAQFISSTDRDGAERNGCTVEQYRAMRHAKGNAWDHYRAAQRARS